MSEETITISLSPDARQALAFLFSPHAQGLKCGEARKAILDAYGADVDAELQRYFGYSR